jgi:hypothetical protein
MLLRLGLGFGRCSPPSPGSRLDRGARNQRVFRLNRCWSRALILRWLQAPEMFYSAIFGENISKTGQVATKRFRS